MSGRKTLNRISIRRRKRTRSKIRGVSSRMRLSVFRANRHIYAQIINDRNQRTLISASSLELKKKSGAKAAKAKIAEAVGSLLAEKAKEAKIKAVVFDRGRYQYHGRVKALAEAARKGGLEF